MKILVTGSAGFIGFHTAARLLDEGHEIVGLDNFNDYYSVELKRRRDRLLRKHTGFSGVECDLCDFRKLEKLFQKNKFKLVCHLAAQVGVRYSLTNPFIYQKSNNEGFLNVLEAGRRTGLKKLVYTSSSSVYGGNRRLPFSESDRVDDPISLYAATKKFNELTAHVYSHLYGLQTIGLRLFTVYGPWGRPDMAVWLFTEAISRGKTIKVFNHGDMRRDFTYIDDVVNGICSALVTAGLPQNDIFNLGNHRSEKLMDLINIIAGCLGMEPKMELLPIQPGDVPDTYADIEKARKALKFNPVTALADGIPKFVKWYHEYHKANRLKAKE
ncbi:MAG: NAD-dependent epimerase/dehydratase family protein [Kiritimatiellia bacterium]|nr:NAD-dependent epimerase/dehydratase family protein [Kiritimatiellia bacterium]